MFGSWGDTRWSADGDHGMWRIARSGEWWFLTVQPTFTRGMLSRDKFTSREDAMAHAQQCEDYGDAPQPVQVEQSEPAPVLNEGMT
jgi:hypothetical protein